MRPEANRPTSECELRFAYWVKFGTSHGHRLVIKMMSTMSSSDVWVYS